MSLLRLQDPEGNDLVTVSLDDGTVDVKEPSKLTDAARAFWDGVHSVRHIFSGYNDMIIRGNIDGKDNSKAGDIIMQPGAAGHGNNGGNVTVHIPDELPQSGHGESLKIDQGTDSPQDE